MKRRSGIALTGLACWLGMAPACAWLHGGDSANPQVTPPPSEIRSTAQATPDHQKNGSPYQVSPPGTDGKSTALDGQRPTFNIDDKPRAVDKSPISNDAASSTYPGMMNIAAAPLPSGPRAENRGEPRLPIDIENRVLQPERPAPVSPDSQSGPGPRVDPPAQPERPAPVQASPPIKGYPPAASSTATATTAKPSGPQIVQITPKPARDPSTQESQSNYPKESPLLAFMRLYLNNHPAEAIAQLGAYDKTRQDLLLGLLSLAAGLTEGDPSKIDSQQVGVILNSLRGIAAPLLPKAPFTLNSACFCDVIRDYGQYDKLSPDRPFLPGGHMEIYVEILNFSTLHRNGHYEIWLSPSADLYNAADQLVPNAHVEFHRGEPEITQTWTPLRDFHRRYTLNLPESLPPGKYTLRLQVIDVHTKRTAVQNLAFTVVAPNRHL
jgi:hypothetical protein